MSHNFFAVSKPLNIGNIFKIKKHAVYKSAASSGDNTGSNGTDTGKAPTTGDNKPADGSVNVVLVVVLTAAISIILTALVMYLIFDKKIKALKN